MMDNSPDIHIPPPTLEGAIALMAALRTPLTGCAWDMEQTFETIAPYTIEEAYEVADAINRGDTEALKSELGDLLFQVLFHARMAQEAGQFDVHDVAAALVDKMVRRHPHVFGAAGPRTAEAQVENWEQLKARERAEKLAADPSLLADVPMALPALMRAEKLTKRAARVGFDWSGPEQVLEKLAEETAEVREALAAGDRDAIEDEIGDMLFVLANLARKAGVDPEQALRRGNAKFERRFRWIEQALAAEGSSPAASNLDVMERLWLAAKAVERG
jgi:nucleoside triphosphate diphosphatase